MASGYGLNGGPNRCFPFWQEVLACYVVNASADDSSGLARCKPVLEDYYECLHHKKEIARVQAMQKAYAHYMIKNPEKDPRSAQEIRTLGLIPDQKAEDVHIKLPKYIPTRKRAAF